MRRLRRAGGERRDREEGRGRRLDHGVAQRDVRRRNAGIDVPQVAGRHQGALREGLSRVEGHVRPDADQQCSVHGADRCGLRVEASSGRDARLLRGLHDAVHAQLAREAQQLRRPDVRLLQEPDGLGSLLPRPQLQERQGRHLRDPERPGHVRVVLQQGVVRQGRRCGPADDVHAASGRLQEVQGEGDHSARIRRPRRLLDRQLGHV